MSVRVSQTFGSLGVQFTRYLFDKSNDVIPLHDHDFDHIAVLVHGRIEAFDKDGRTEEMSFHVPTLFRAHVPHGLRALTDGAVMLQVAEIQPQGGVK